MKLTRYTKFTGDLSSSFGLDDLMQALSDFLLDSGFQDPMSRYQNFDGEHTIEELIDKSISRMKDESFLNAEEPQASGDVDQGEAPGDPRFELTDKGMD